MLRKIFKKQAGERFIDIYGWPWQSTNLLDVLRTPDMIFATSVAAMGATMDLISGSANPAMSIFMGTMFGLFSKGVSFKVTQVIADGYRDSDIKTVKDYAIDTEGRMPPPEFVDFLNRQLKTLRWMHGSFIIVGGSMLGMSGSAPMSRNFNAIANGQLPTGWDIVQSLAFIVPVLSSVQTLHTIHKLLKGDYVFCGKPPHLPSAESKPVTNGGFAPVPVRVK